MRDKLSLLCMAAIMTLGITSSACDGIGLGADEPQCTFDDDCGADQVCDTASETCLEQCTTDTECDNGYKCLDRGGNSMGKTCQLDPSTNNTNACTANEQCKENELCDSGSGMCKAINANNTNNTNNTYYAVQIIDTSSGDSCTSTTNDEGDPGSDITYVRLLDAAGEVIGYGQHITSEITSNNIESGFQSTGHLDGEAPDIDDQSCPMESGGSRFRLETVVSLGCGGWLTVFFKGLDNNTPRVPLQEGYTVEVGEFAPVCSGGTGEGTDSYQLYLCTDTASETSGDCTHLLSNNDLKGVDSSVVSFPTP